MDYGIHHPLFSVAEKLLLDILLDKSRHYCNWGVVWGDGETVRDGGICYASVRSLKHGFADVQGTEKAYFVVNNTQPGNAFEPVWNGISPLNTEEKIKYINWVVNESFWAEDFLTKDPKEVLERGFIMSPKRTGVFVISGAIALRYLAEKPIKIKLWNILSQTVNSEAAMVLSHILVPQKGILPTVFSVYPTKFCGGHLLFDIVEKSTLQNFIKKAPFLTGKNDTFSKNSTFEGYGVMWTDSSYEIERNINLECDFVTIHKELVFGVLKRIFRIKEKDLPDAAKIWVENNL